MTVSHNLPIYVYVYFVDGLRYLTVNFGNSPGTALLRFYPAAAEVSSASSALCLRFNVYVSSPAVELLVDVSDMSEDDGDVRSDNNVNHHQQVGTGTHSLTVLRGRQYVVFTARKIKVNRIPDKVYMRHIWYGDGSCSNDATGK